MADFYRKVKIFFCDFPIIATILNNINNSFYPFCTTFQQQSGNDTNLFLFIVSDYDFVCRSPDTPYKRLLDGHGRGFGDWSYEENCPLGSYICAIRTQVEFPQGFGDDYGLNDAQFYCCKFSNPW